LAVLALTSVFPKIYICFLSVSRFGNSVFAQL
jgi:hypothetical protein